MEGPPKGWMAGRPSDRLDWRIREDFRKAIARHAKAKNWEGIMKGLLAGMGGGRSTEGLLEGRMAGMCLEGLLDGEKAERALKGLMAGTGG